MPSSYSPSLRFELIANGEQPGTWGTTTNTNIGTLVEGSIAGYTTVSVTSPGQALTISNGVADQARLAMLRLTTTLTSVFAVFAPPVSKQYTVFNDTAYTAVIYNSTVAGNTTPAGLGVTILAGTSVAVWSDGVNMRAQNSVLANGTANGVVYLNSNKVATTSSALVFDGTNLGVGTTTLNAKFTVSGTGSSTGAEIRAINTATAVDNRASVRVMTGANTYGGGLVATNATDSTYPPNSIFLSSFDAIPLTFGTGNSERARIDPAGNFGLGVTPSVWGSSYKALDIGSQSGIFAQGAALTAASNVYVNSSAQSIYKTTTAAGKYEINGNSHTWYIAPSGTAGSTITFTTAMALSSTGNLLVGRTTGSFNNTPGCIFTPAGTLASEGQNPNIQLNKTSLAVTGSLVDFFYQLSGVGSISTNGTSTTYGTSSDYRLKYDVAPLRNALQRVAALKPCTYKWNSDGSAGEGFIAHELAEVCPQAVTGEKDGVNADGKPMYQGIDTSFLVALLTAAIQEQQATISELRTRIEALEAR